MTTSQSQLVSVTNGKVTTSSLLVAERFDKNHKNILKAIRSMDCSAEFNRLNFEPIAFNDAMGRAQPAYNITRDGFMFLCMGFTGAEAAQWKETYIETFNAMEATLRQQQLQIVPDIRAANVELVRSNEKLSNDLQRLHRSDSVQRELLVVLAHNLLVADNGLARRVGKYANAGLSIADIAKLTRCSAERIRRLRGALEACELVTLRPNAHLARVLALRISDKTPLQKLESAEAQYAFACEAAGLQPAIALGDPARAAAAALRQAAKLKPGQANNTMGGAA